MTQQLAIRDQTGPTESEFFVLKEQAVMLIKSGFLPQAIKTPEQAMAIILTGRELGIGTMAALNTINVISQKPMISPQLMLALIERSGQLEDIRITAKQSPDGKNDYVSVTMKRKGRSEHTEMFGTKEAFALGLLGKDNYKKQASTMFRWRAVAACARVVFPDVILGLYTPDEMGEEVTETGEIAEPVAMEKQTQTVVRMPQLVEAPKQESPAAETKTDYTDEWNNALANPVKKDKAVSPETKGRLLVEGGYVKQTNNGFEVVDTAEGEFFTVTKPGGVIHCTCLDYTEGRQTNDKYRCAHIEAVKLFLVSKPQQQLHKSERNDGK